MKKRNLVLAIIVFMGVFAVSCDNDDNGGETIAPLEGKWLLTHVGTTIDGAETITEAPQNVSGCDKDYMDLRLSKVVVFGDYDSTISDCALTTEEGVYTRSHNNLTTSINDLSKTQDIVNLTLTELKLKASNGAISIYKR